MKEVRQKRCSNERVQSNNIGKGLIWHLSVVSQLPHSSSGALSSTATWLQTSAGKLSCQLIIQALTNSSTNWTRRVHTTSFFYFAVTNTNRRRKRWRYDCCGQFISGTRHIRLTSLRIIHVAIKSYFCRLFQRSHCPKCSFYHVDLRMRLFLARTCFYHFLLN